MCESTIRVVDGDEDHCTAGHDLDCCMRQNLCSTTPEVDNICNSIDANVNDMIDELPDLSHQRPYMFETGGPGNNCDAPVDNCGSAIDPNAFVTDWQLPALPEADEPLFLDHLDQDCDGDGVPDAIDNCCA